MYLLYKDNSLIHIALVLAFLFIFPLTIKINFLGRSGVYFINFISLTIMDLLYKQKITADEIFVLMMFEFGHDQIICATIIK